MMCPIDNVFAHARIGVRSQASEYCDERLEDRVAWSLADQKTTGVRGLESEIGIGVAAVLHERRDHALEFPTADGAVCPAPPIVQLPQH